MPYPVVWIIRNPALDEAAAALSANKEVTNSERSPNCFLCGKVSSLTPEGHDYLGQVAVFKTYLPPSGDGDECRGGVDTCANCAQGVSTVWSLAQQIEALRQEIVNIVTALRKREHPLSKEVLDDGQFDQEIDEASVDFCGSPADFDDTVIKHEIPSSEDESTLNDDNYMETIGTDGIHGAQGMEERSLSGEVKVPHFEVGIPARELGPKRKTRATRKLPKDIISSDSELSEESDTDFEQDSKPCPSKRSRGRPPKNTIISKTHACPHCKKLYSTRRILMNHIRLGYCKQNPTKTFPCPSCADSFPSRRLLRTHRSHHGKVCPYCQKVCKSSVRLSRHIKWLHTNETFSCSLCSKKLATQKSWAIHEATVCKVPDKDWGPERLKEFNITLVTCPVPGCGKQFDSTSPIHLKEHASSHSGNPRKPRITDALNLPDDIRRPEETEPDQNCKRRPKGCQPKKRITSPALCSHCGKVYATRKGLQNHIRLGHCKQIPKNKNKFLCETCGEKLPTPGSLRTHINRVHKYRCNYCPKVLTTKSHLKCHVNWVHGQETYYSCSACSKKLANRKSWAIHEASVCKVSGWSEERLKTEFNLTLHLCPVQGCGKLFNRPPDLKAHVSIHPNFSVVQKTEIVGDALSIDDPEQESYSEEKTESHPSFKVNLLKSKTDRNQNKWPCPHCGRILTERRSLQAHIRTVHDKKYRYSCPHCEKSFATRYNLSCHVKWVHTKEVFSCSLCAKKLATQKSWAIHEATICKVDGCSAERLKTEFNITLVPCPVQGCGKLFDQGHASTIQRHVFFHAASDTSLPLAPQIRLPL